MTADWHAAPELRVRGQIENFCHDAFAPRGCRKGRLRHPHLDRHRNRSCPRVVAPPRFEPPTSNRPQSPTDRESKCPTQLAEANNSGPKIGSPLTNALRSRSTCSSAGVIDAA